jgi:hypothetical protein
LIVRIEFKLTLADVTALCICVVTVGDVALHQQGALTDLGRQCRRRGVSVIMVQSSWEPLEATEAHRVAIDKMVFAQFPGIQVSKVGTVAGVSVYVIGRGPEVRGELSTAGSAVIPTHWRLRRAGTASAIAEMVPRVPEFLPRMTCRSWHDHFGAIWFGHITKRSAEAIARRNAQAKVRQPWKYRGSASASSSSGLQADASTIVEDVRQASAAGSRRERERMSVSESPAPWRRRHERAVSPDDL